MPTNESPDPKTAPGQMTAESRTALLANIAEINAKMSVKKPPLSYEDRLPLIIQSNGLMKQYFVQLPRYTLGRCPVCGTPLEDVFDPWGLDGFWWLESLPVSRPKLSSCEHFRVLTGAVNLNEKPPQGGDQECYPGPEVPYVIPRALKYPTMVAVILSIPMKNGYTAYPISYFSSEAPPTPALANPWTKKTFSYLHPSGRAVFTILSDPWDFELMPWVEEGKIQWIDAGDPNFTLKSAPASRCPYVNLKGLRERQTIVKDKRYTIPPPNNEEFDPFSG